MYPFPIKTDVLADYPVLFPKYGLGFLSKSDSPKDYSEAIDSAINSSLDIYKSKQYAISNFVKNELSWSVLGPRLFNFYQESL